jgi:hypothetical protein
MSMFIEHVRGKYITTYTELIVRIKGKHFRNVTISQSY